MVIMTAPPPAGALFGVTAAMTGGSEAATVKGAGALAPPSGAWFTTVTAEVPGAAVRAAGTTAVSCVGETYVVASEVPFQEAVDTPAAKFAPCIVIVRSPPPAATLFGVKAASTGGGVAPVDPVTLKVAGALDPPPVAWLATVTEATPGVAVRAAGTTAASCVGET
jgi:hypothetical protein